MTNRELPQPAIVVGLTADADGYVTHIVRQAAQFATAFGAGLVVVSVDTGRLPIALAPDGSVIAFDLDPDVADEVTERVDPDLTAAVDAAVRRYQVPVRYQERAGEAVRELAAAADECDALAIVVGARRPGLRAGAHELLSGSIASHLVHRQARPVIVIPIRQYNAEDASEVGS